jgi:hypothetical protein
MASQTKQLLFDVSHIPDCHSGVSGTCADQKLVKWRAVNAQNLLNVSLNGTGGSFGVSHIPDFKLFIVTNSSENILIEMVPSDILNDSIMRGVKTMQRLEVNLVIWQLIDVPDARLLVIRPREKKPLFYRVPCEPISLLIMAFKFQIWFNLVVCWNLRVLIIVKDVDVTTCCFGGDNLLVLGHVPSFVDLPLMVNLNVNLDASLLILRDA